MASAANAISATLYDRLPYDFIRDIAPIAGIARVANVMLAHPSLPAASVPELIAYAKANPGRISMASAGIGSPQHLAGELFKMMAGVDMLHVPYRGGGPALTDLLGGQVQVSFSTTVSSAGYIKAGKLRALAVTTAVRSEALPDVPVMADYVPGYEASTWYGIAAPKGTPPDVIGRLNREANAALADARFKARLADLGGTGLAGSPADFAGLIAGETEKWGRVVKFAGVKA
jgi:tripartite-type tricarboxylate transporter receptor subunit TctC